MVFPGTERSPASGGKSMVLAPSAGNKTCGGMRVCLAREPGDGAGPRAGVGPPAPELGVGGLVPVQPLQELHLPLLWGARGVQLEVRWRRSHPAGGGGPKARMYGISCWFASSAAPTATCMSSRMRVSAWDRGTVAQTASLSSEGSGRRGRQRTPPSLPPPGKGTEEGTLHTAGSARGPQRCMRWGEKGAWSKAEATGDPRSASSREILRCRPEKK